jgi:RNA polymerase sigma-70 factor (ECF subfamily)
MEASVDGALVELHLSGHGDAFGALYREYFSRLVRLCRARTGDLATAEDLAQETLLRALNHIDSFQLDRPMWPWLKTIAVRLTIDYSRQRRPEPCEDPCEGRSVSDDTAWLEDGPILAEALAGLPARQRVALKLRYLDDWSPSEAAAALGLTRPAFDQLLFRARGKLRTEYRRVCGEAPAGVLALVWPLLAVASRVRHAAWRARIAVQTASLPVHAAADAMVGLVVAASVGAVALGAALGSMPSAAPVSAVSSTQLDSDQAALFAAGGFASVNHADAPGEAGTPSGHDSWAVEPASPALVPSDYRDAAVRLAALPDVASDPIQTANLPSASAPDASTAAAPQGPVSADRLAPAVAGAVLADAALPGAALPEAAFPHLPELDLHEGLGL